MEKINANATNKLPYLLFEHLEELRRARRRDLRLLKSKMHLTMNLIQTYKPRLMECGLEDLRTVRRELKFKEKLQTKVREMQNGKKKPNHTNI